MNPILRNILAIIVGVIVGIFVNSNLIKVGYSVTPIPGFDPNDPYAVENLSIIYKKLDFKFYVFPFLAHAIGTLTGAIVAGIIAKTYKMTFAITVGGIFLLGGIMVNYLITGPIWFILVDLIFAYIPMGRLGGKIALKFMKNSSINDKVDDILDAGP